MPFNIGVPEVIVLLVIGLIIFGPEKLPDLARKVARVLRYVRGIANGARGQLAEHLGPEFADLRPQSLVQNLLGPDLDEVKAVVSDTRNSLLDAKGTLESAGTSVAKAGRGALAGLPAAPSLAAAAATATVAAGTSPVRTQTVSAPSGPVQTPTARPDDYTTPFDPEST